MMILYLLVARRLKAPSRRSDGRVATHPRSSCGSAPAARSPSSTLPLIVIGALRLQRERHAGLADRGLLDEVVLGRVPRRGRPARRSGSRCRRRFCATLVALVLGTLLSLGGLAVPLLRARDGLARRHPADRAAGHHHRARAPDDLHELSASTFGLLTIIIGHATFCIVVVYNNALARLRRLSASFEEASADLGADAWQTFRYVTFPELRTALLAGALLAFALSFDEVIVTLFTSGAQQTLPIWIFANLFRPRRAADRQRGRAVRDRGRRSSRSTSRRS